MKDSSAMILTGGICFIVGALAFVAVFGYLAAKLNYPKVLDGEAEDVLPRLRYDDARGLDYLRVAAAVVGAWRRRRGGRAA